MRDLAWETEQLERHRPHLQAVAYRMLGSASEAEDALQESWLRLSRSRQEMIGNPRAWLTTIVGRVCIDMLRAGRARREEYLGGWVPEPLVESDEEADPERQALMADSVGLALLVVLETLTPAERVAFVLHDMFAVPFAEIAGIIDRDPGAARQLASRARRRIRGATPQSDADPGRQREMVAAFLAASRAGDFDALVALLDPRAVLRVAGARQLQQELRGDAAIAHKFAAAGPAVATLCHLARVNGHAGLVVETREGLAGAVGFTISGGMITTVDVTLDPGKLEGLDDLVGAARDREPAPARRGTGEPRRHTSASQPSPTERVISEALDWPGVHRADGHLGSVALCVGGHELGHLHGDTLADVPKEPGPAARAIDDRTAHDPGWVTVALDTEQGVQHALALLRANHQAMERLAQT